MGEGPTQGLRDRAIAWLEKEVPPARIKHVLGVERMAAELAGVHGLDVSKAARAGLLHDLAKYFKPARLLAMARSAGIEIDPVLEAHPHLLHADASALVAEETFGITDRAVLDAIRNHTLGRPGMDELSCTIFLADALEPGRGDTLRLNELRRLSRKHLLRGVAVTCDDSLRYLLDTRKPIHPRTVETRNWALRAGRDRRPNLLERGAMSGTGSERHGAGSS